MNVNEAKSIEAQQADGERAEELRMMQDGYYWAKSDGRWMLVEMFNSSVYIVGKEGSRDPAAFTFGPRIEPPIEA